MTQRQPHQPQKNTAPTSHGLKRQRCWVQSSPAALDNHVRSTFHPEFSNDPHVSTISTLEMLPPGFIHDLRARVFVQFDQGVVVLQDDPVMDGEVSTNGLFHVLGSKIIQFWSKEKWIQFWMPSTHNRNCFRSLAFFARSKTCQLVYTNRPRASTSMDILQQTPLSE